MLNKNEDNFNTEFKLLIELLLTSITSALSFTLGYLAAFRVPEVPAITEAGYFVLTIIHKSLSEHVWSILVYNRTANIFFTIVATLFIISRINEEKIFCILEPTYFFIKKCVQSLKNLLNTLFENRILFLILWIYLILLAAFNLDYYDGQPLMLEVFKDQLTPVPKILFVFLFLSSLALIPITKFLSDKLKSGRVLILLIASLVSMSMSYYIGYKFAGAYLNFPLVRQNESEEKVSPLVWKTGNVLYLVECAPKGVYAIRGVSDGKTIFYADIDRNLVRNACAGL